MRKLASILLFLTCGSICVCAQTRSQIYGLYQWYAERGDYLISDIRPKFRAVLSPSERQLELGLKYNMIVTGNTNAYATMDGTTIITASMLQIIDSMATMLSASEAFGNSECLTGYINYLSEGTRQNSRLVANHKPAQPILMAFSFWASRPDICGGFTEPRFRADAKADNLREYLVYSSLIYLVGHEFAHHRNGDTKYHMVNVERRRRDAANGIDVTWEVIPEEQKPKEARADTFAFQKMMEMGYNPYGAVPVLLFFGGIEDFSAEQTEDADHPAAILRFDEMIEDATRDPSFQAAIKKLHKEQEWQNFTAQIKALTQAPNE